MYKIDSILANGHVFVVSDMQEKKFPLTCFEGAYFDMLIDGTADFNKYYKWGISGAHLFGAIQIDDNGRVSFTSDAVHILGDEITISARSTSTGTESSYTFSPEIFFEDDIANERSPWLEAGIALNQEGYLYPQIEDLVGVEPVDQFARYVGPVLWGEWGDLQTYGWLESVTNGLFWSSSEVSESSAMSAQLGRGCSKRAYPKHMELAVVGMIKK